MLAALVAIGGCTAVHEAPAAASGEIATLPIGDWVCERPGNALGAAGVRVPAEDFAVLHASRYAVGEDTGTYLMTGDEVQMTSGPRAGQRYRRISANFVRKLNADGSDSTLRCVRVVPNNGS